MPPVPCMPWGVGGRGAKACTRSQNASVLVCLWERVGLGSIDALILKPSAAIGLIDPDQRDRVAGRKAFRECFCGSCLDLSPAGRKFRVVHHFGSAPGSGMTRLRSPSSTTKTARSL